MGINDDVLFNKPEKKDEDQTEQKEEVIAIEPQFDLSSSKFFEASHVFSQLALKDSFVSFITAEDKLFWNYLPFSSKKINRNKLKYQTLSKDQKKNPNVQFDTIINNDNSGYSLVFEGIHDTFTLLEKVQPILNIKNIKYFHSEPLETALTKSVLSFFDFPHDQYALILFLTKDTKIAVILQGHNFVKSFPLIIQATDKDIIREAIVSKIMLEQDISAINITQNVVVAGDYCSKDDISFFKENFNSSSVNAFSFNNPNRDHFSFNVEIDPKINDLDIPKFLPSISLCLNILHPKNKTNLNVNLLPQLVIDKQKIFKLNWHGFLALSLVFASTIWTTYGVLNANIELRKVQAQNQQYMFQLNQKKSFENVLRQFTTQLESFESGRKQVTDIIKNKNQWAFIFNKITNYCSSHSYFWINEIKGNEENFNVIGTSYNKNNISAFSYLFPEASIKKIALNKIENEVVWDFEITFNYPDPALYNPLFNEINIKVDTPKTESVKVITPAVKDEPKKIVQKPETVKPKPSQPVITKNDNNKPVVKTPPPKKVTITVTEKPKTQTVKKGRSSDTYVESRIALQKADYSKAIQGFLKFIEDHPNHRLIPMANFLLAESYSLSDQTGNAIIYYQKVVKLRKKKVVDSIYKLSECYAKQNNPTKQKEYLQFLVNKYPRHYYGKKAAQDLESLGGNE
jgi:TolA-binding protein